MRAMGLDEVRLEVNPELETLFIERLKSEGYKVEQSATLNGGSGTQHTFDILARKSHGFVSYTIAIGIIKHDSDQEIKLGEVFTFDDKCYDCGIRDKVLIISPQLHPAAQRFAQSQGINVFDEKNLEVFLSTPAHIRQAQVEEDTPVSFETKPQLLQYLVDLGYAVKENAKVNGKSGAEYTFDILAELDEGSIIHRLGMDAITTDEVSLNEVSLFDAKAYDAGIYRKVLLISGEISTQANQFAQRQKIKVIKFSSLVEELPDRQDIPHELTDQKEVLQEIESPGQEPPAEGLVLQEDEPASLQSDTEDLLVKAPEVRQEGKPRRSLISRLNFMSRTHTANPDKRGEQIEQLANQLREGLSYQGYEVTPNASIKGASDAEYTFDIMAHRNYGFIGCEIAVGIVIAEDGGEIEMEDVSLFDEKCYQCGIPYKVLITLPRLSFIANRFAQGHHIKVFDAEAVEILLSSLPLINPTEEKAPDSFRTRSEVVETLQLFGFHAEENARVKGRSGVEYSFDILALLDDSLLTLRLGIDDITGDIVDLNQLSLLDAKYHDTGIEERALLSSGKLTAEAKRFAKQQRIRIIEKEEAPGSIISELPLAPGEEEPKARLSKASQPEALQLIPEAVARRFTAIPIAITDNRLEVAMVNPADISALQVLEYHSKRRIKPIAADEKEIQGAIDFNYRSFGHIEEQVAFIDTGTEAAEEEDLVQATANVPVANTLRLIMDEAVKSRASDIHIEPQEKRLRIRYRIDGVLQDVMSLPLRVHPALTSRIKIMAEMNITDHLRPQDGQFSTEVRGKPIDVRVATSPTVYGETTVLRLLDKSLGVFDLSQLGFSAQAQVKYDNVLKSPFGMILISGPTGAGKTTTLYASVNTLDKTSRNIVTIEDPVEYRFDNMNQIQINTRAGLTFATGLRSILRLDPDVILVGEIRDAETARIAVQAALTGHLVLSSIHANDVVGVIFRLLDLGIEPSLVCSAVIGVAAQRMVRRICPDCSSYIEAPPFEQLVYEREMGEKPERFLCGSGCELCAYSGYRGRIGIFEVLPISDEIRMMILKGASTVQIRKQTIKEGMIPLVKDGMLKVEQGVTTVSEVLRNTYFVE